jgi:ABC-2 type transport system permease protein
MLTIILNIARVHFRLTFNSRSVLLTYLFVPLLFTFLIGQASGEGDSNNPVVWNLLVLNEDEGNLGSVLVERLTNNASLAVSTVVDIDAGTAAVENGEAVGLLILPANFSQSLLQGISLDFIVDPTVITQAQAVEQLVLVEVSKIGGSLGAAQFSTNVAEQLTLFSTAAEEEIYFEAGVEQALAAWESPPITISTNAETSSIPAGNALSSPGMMVMFTMFLMLGGAAVLVVEREQGTLRRLLAMPFDRANILLGKMLGIYLAGLFQIVFLILAGIILFGVGWGQSPLALALMVLGFAFAVTGLSIAMAALARTPAQVNSLTTLVVLSISALGGAWWPLEVVPPILQTVAHFTPVAWAMDGFHDIVTRGLDVTAVLPEFSVLVGFGLVFMLIGLLRFRYE